jgi:hypothetical protein
MAHLRHAVLSDARALCTQEQTSAADLEARALALDAIEKRVVSLARCRLAPTIKRCRQQATPRCAPWLLA